MRKGVYQRCREHQTKYIPSSAQVLARKHLTLYTVVGTSTYQTFREFMYRQQIQSVLASKIVLKSQLFPRVVSSCQVGVGFRDQEHILLSMAETARLSDKIFLPCIEGLGWVWDRVRAARPDYSPRCFTCHATSCPLAHSPCPAARPMFSLQSNKDQLLIRMEAGLQRPGSQFLHHTCKQRATPALPTTFLYFQFCTVSRTL